MNYRTPLIRMGFTLIGSSAGRRLQDIRACAALDADSLATFVAQKRRALVRHAARTVPYYRDVLTERLADADWSRGPDQWSSIPILTKDILRRRFEDLRSDDLARRRWFVNHTGGSTGEPTRVIQDQWYHDWNMANKLYYREFAGQELGWPELRFWSSERDMLGARDNAMQRLQQWVFNRTDLGTFRMRPEDMRAFARTWVRVRPTWIEGYAVTLHEFARFVREDGLRLPPPRAVLATAETLTPDMRATMGEAFQAPVINRYGSREVGDVACSCVADTALHISTWNNYVEIIGIDGLPARPGDVGRVIVTNLNNYAMPLIRYDIGDLAVIADGRVCACGRVTPRLERVEGRVVSVFRAADGAVVSGGYFIHLIGSVYDRGVVRKFQVVQRAPDHVEVRLVVSRPADLEPDRPGIEGRIRAVMGVGCRITWSFVDDIPPLPSGKFEYTRTEI